MNSIHYITGDATAPSGAGSKIVVHVCNDVGAWGAGFVLAISKRWKEPERRYRAWHAGGSQDDPPFELGQVQCVEAASDIVIANMIGQKGIRSSGGAPPIRYGAIEEGLACVAAKALKDGASVHMPRIGCGLAGGQWSEIEPLIQRQLIVRGVAVTVYDFAR